MNHYFLQYDETDCGAAALATVLSILKNKVSLYEVKNRIFKDAYGSSIQDIVDSANRFDVDAEGLTGTLDELILEIKSTTIRYPFIAHIEKTNGQMHFIVVRNIKKNKVFVFDPGIGKYHMSLEDFNKSWTGNIISFNDSKQEKKIYAKVSLKDSLQLVKPYRVKLMSISFLILIISLMSILGAKSYQIIIDNFTQAQTENVILLKSISVSRNTFFLGLIIFYLLKNVISLSISILLNSTDIDFQKHLRKNFFLNFFRLKIPFIESKKSGDSLTRVNDLENIGNFFSKIVTKFFSDIIMIFVGGIALISINFRLTLIVFIIVLFYCLASIIIVPRFNKKQRELLEYDANVVSDFSEDIKLIELIKNQQMEHNFFDKLVVTSDKFFHSKKMFGVLEIIFSFVTSNIQEIGMVTVLWVGIIQISNNILTLGELIAFESIMGLFITPIINMISMQKDYQQFIVSYERVLEYEKSDSEFYISETSRLDIDTIIAKKLSFKYGSKQVIQNLNFEIEQGDRIFVDGSNGSGKSTLFKLLTKLCMNYSGSLSINGQEVSELAVNEVRNNIEYTPSTCTVFSGNLYENLMGNNTNPDSEHFLKELIDSGIINNLLSDMGEGLNSIVLEDGANLSEGQKQTISFCRTLLSKKSVLIFDESTSQIDRETEKNLLDFLFSKRENCTLIFTDHNDYVRRKCKKIIKM
ncbi:peptidase domain-containing ABC transporter [Enterococcus casseliflavus]|uniref:peptidase domain-containing ABC transporter n=3 Tax=Enterococcus TaxID=1350 RepID=UPI001432FB96|nr:peptidase domain-containing ABC transporter [Enterococcus casseliflavus]NKD39827.1 peptidase domain-containing ABC transporter [Enterococcus casseliflavus]